jgi:UDP-N-acetylmuramate--alanine ligase
LNSLVNNNCNAKKFIDLKKILQYITVNDIVLTLGAGDVWKIGEELLKMI